MTLTLDLDSMIDSSVLAFLCRRLPVRHGPISQHQPPTAILRNLIDVGESSRPVT